MSSNKSSNKITLLNKINHKPIIIESIFSYALERPYILVNFITNDEYLKLAMKNTFDHIKKNNDLSKEIIVNINLYIKYKKIFDIISKCLEENMDQKKIVPFLQKKPSIKTDIFNNEDVNNFLKKNKGAYSILKRKSDLFKNDELYDVLNYFKFNEKNDTFLEYLKEQKKFGLFLEAIYFFDEQFFEELKNNFDFKKFPYFTKKYRKFCKAEIKKKIY